MFTLQLFRRRQLTDKNVEAHDTSPEKDLENFDFREVANCMGTTDIFESKDLFAKG